MNLIAAVVDDFEGIAASPSLSKKIIDKLDNLLKVLKEAANDLRILSIKVLQMLVNIKSLTDAQLKLIIESLIDTSDKSYANDGIVALKHILAVKGQVDLSSLKNKCWKNYSQAFLNTGHFNLKNLITEFIMFTNDSKNSL